MTTPPDEPFQSLKDAWQLYLDMTEDVAAAHARAMLNDEQPSEMWTSLPGRINSTQIAIDELAGPSDTFKDRRHNRAERHEIAGVNEALGSAHKALVGRADAELTYLKHEQRVQASVESGADVDYDALERDRSHFTTSQDTLAQARANLALRIENLADDSGSGLFSKP
ncbi:MAG: hypothetical protein ACR2NG_08130 [Acidimicrobiia bacterium]